MGNKQSTGETGRKEQPHMGWAQSMEGKNQGNKDQEGTGSPRGQLQQQPPSLLGQRAVSYLTRASLSLAFCSSSCLTW